MSVARTGSSTKIPPSGLETRVANRKQELISEIVEHKMNSSRVGAAEAIEKIKARLSELARIMKGGVVDGWANVSPSAELELDEWISR
jgi:predicted small metal-binding protein